MPAGPANLRPTPLAAAALLAGWMLLAGCTREPRSPPLALPPTPAADAPVDPALRIVTALSPLRGEPSKGGAPGAVLATLHRGERVTWLATRDDQARVRASDGVEGWIRGASLLPAVEVQEGTVLATALAFDRPDLLAVNARKKVEAGTLVFVRKTKDLFTEVDAGPGPSTWILTDRVSVQPADVAAARLVEKARWLARNDRRAEALEVLALLRARQPGSPLAPVLAVDLGETPPDAAAGPSGPSGPTGLSDPPGPSGAGGSTGTP